MAIAPDWLQPVKVPAPLAAPTNIDVPHIDMVRTFCARIEAARICYFNGEAESFDKLTVALDIGKIFMKSAWRLLEENQDRMRIESREAKETICNGIIGAASFMKRAYQAKAVIFEDRGWDF